MSAPVLCLHGFAGTPEDFAPVVAALRRRGHGGAVSALALPGHSAACPIDGPIAFDEHVDRLAARIAFVSPAPVHLLGYSLGARLALGVLMRHPKLVTRATLVGVHPGLASDVERAERRAADERWAVRIERDGLADFLDEWEAQPLFASQAALPPEQRAALRARRTRHEPRALASALRALSLAAMPDRRPGLAAIRIPLDVVAGALDEKFREIATDVVAAAPCARAVTVPDAGHNVPLERPDAIAALLAQAARWPVEAGA